MIKQTDKLSFDVNNKEHINIYSKFLQNNRSWKGLCPFKLEGVYESVPHMIEAKVTEMYCKVSSEH